MSRAERWAMRLGIGLGFVVVLCSSCQAQVQGAAPPAAENLKLMVFVDTLNIAVTSPNQTYLTWVYAKATPTAWPSSGVMVGFSCRTLKVRRYYHVVYRMRSDSLGVIGPVVEDDSGWVPMSDPRIFNIVCSVGATREYIPNKAIVPDPQPEHTDPRWRAS